MGNYELLAVQAIESIVFMSTSIPFGATLRRLLMRRLCFISMIIAVLLAMTVFVSAQSSATLSGTVKDTTGAVVIGANVTIQNQATGEQRKIVTNKDGFFSFAALSVATYKVTVSAKNFARYEVKDIGLNANDTKTLTIDLPLATVTEIVEVSGTLSTVALVDSGEKSSVLTTKDLQATTLSSRNAAEIVKIMGGATMTANGGKNTPNTTSTIGINGYTVGGNAAGLGGTQINGQALDITLDGGHVFDPGASGSATPVNPNMDMISEVKVMASNFSAEYEKGPVVFNAETKGGGRDFHGQVRFGAQNPIFNSTDANNKALGAPKSDGRAYYPSAQIGGPIPFGSYNKNHNKLFFFDGFEAYRQKVDGGVDVANVMTDGMLNGDFSATEIAKMAGTNGIWNLNSVPGDYSGTGQPWSSARPGCTITNGVMTQACIDPSGLIYLRTMLPRPNADPILTKGYNYVMPILAGQNSWQNIARVDWSISDNTKAYVRYSRQRELSEQPLGLWGNSGATGVVPSPTPINGSYKSDSIAFTLTHVFSPTMTSESTFYYTTEGMPNSPQDFSKISRSALGLSWKTHFDNNDQVPAITAWGSSFPTLGSGNNLGTDFSPTGFRNKPGMMANKGMPSLRENLTKVIGTHTLKFGAFWEHIYNKQDNWGTYMGAYQVAQGWGTGVGNAYADVLMGIIDGQYDEAQLPAPTQISQNMYEFYVNDHWKINRRLSVDVGMRFDHFGKPYSSIQNLGLAIWDESKYNNDPAQVDAHTGVSWHGLDHSIPLSGANSRLFYYSPRFGLAWDVFGDAKTIVRGGWGLYRSYDSLQSGSYVGPGQTGMGAASFHCDAWSCPTIESIGAVQVNHPLPAGLPPGSIGVSVMDPKNDQQPLVTTYSLNVDQQLAGKFLLELSYVGNHSDDQQSQIDINAVPVGTIPYSYVVACNAASNCNNDSYRPRTNYKAITESVTLGKSQFDSFQVALHRSIGWLNLRTNYMWSKTYSVGDFTAGNGSTGAFPDLGLHEYWGISPQHRPHTFNIAYTVNLPNVRSGNSFVKHMANGWSISGITSWNSGANQTAQNYGLNYKQDDGPSGSGIFNSNVAKIGSPQVNLHPYIVPGCQISVHQSVIVSGSKAMRLINPACFQAAAMGTAGTTSMPYIAGPAYFNSDLSFTKNVSITERHKLEFRVQAFNFLNHDQWSFDTGDGNIKAEFDSTGNLKNSNFGVATRKFGHRLIELGIKYSF